MRSVGKLLSCFVTERKHRTVKSAALFSFRHIEHTVTIDLVNRFCEEIVDTKTLYKCRFLTNAKKVDLGGVSALTSLNATLECGTLCAGDIVCVDIDGQLRIGRVANFFAATEDDDVLSQIQTFTRTMQGCVFNTANAISHIVSTSRIVCALAWAEESRSSVRVILPFHLSNHEIA